MAKFVDLMISRSNLDDNSAEGLKAFTAKVVALGYTDFHNGAMFEVGRIMPHLGYVCLEVAGYETHDMCLCNHPDSTDIVADTEEEFLAIAAQYAPKEAK